MLEIDKCVIQEAEFGCIPACVSTILQISYEQTIKCFSTDFDKQGIDIKFAADYLAGLGFSCISKFADYYNNYEFVSREILKPFADIHIVSIIETIESITGHGIIMLHNGKLLSPHDGKEFNNEILLARSVYGFYYPANWWVTNSKRGAINALDSSSNSLNLSSN
jgi:hypothetical protein